MNDRVKSRRETVGKLLRTDGVARQPLHEEVRRTRRRIRRLSRGHLDPNGRFMTFWDGAIILALTMMVFVTPVEVCFSASEPSRAQLNTVVSCVVWGGADAISSSWSARRKGDNRTC